MTAHYIEPKHLIPKIRRWHTVAGLCLMRGYRTGAELGVSGGRFTAFLCATIQDLSMIAVDLWEPQPESEAEGSETYEWDHEAAYKNFCNLSQELFPDRVHIRRMKTVEAALLVEDGSLDFVFIDADHTYEGCKADIEAWFPKVRSKGMVCGHDYNWPTVKQAVDERSWRIVIGSDNVWVHIKP